MIAGTNYCRLRGNYGRGGGTRSIVNILVCFVIGHRSCGVWIKISCGCWAGGGIKNGRRFFFVNRSGADWIGEPLEKRLMNAKLNHLTIQLTPWLLLLTFCGNLRSRCCSCQLSCSICISHWFFVVYRKQISFSLIFSSKLPLVVFGLVCCQRI